MITTWTILHRGGSGAPCVPAGGYDSASLRYLPQRVIRMKRRPNQRQFVLAIIAGDIERVRTMHKAGASATESDQFGWLPIHRAAANDCDEIIRLLIKWGSPLEARGTEGWTPLH